VRVRWSIKIVGRRDGIMFKGMMRMGSISGVMVDSECM
jgi:hypothetical protein